MASEGWIDERVGGLDDPFEGEGACQREGTWDGPISQVVRWL